MNKKELKELKKYYNKHYKGMLSKTILGLLISGGFVAWFMYEIITKI